ncbi:MAG: adenine deaminase, partial [Armatimonadetes bacterium]|nr:adenine deaminase [Armatimonadota bacterium]
LGVPAHRAVRAATLTAAQRFGLVDRGLVAPGRRADLAVVDDLVGFNVIHTVSAGRLVEPAAGEGAEDVPAVVSDSCRPGDLSLDRLRLSASRPEGTRLAARTIELVPGQILTRATETQVVVRAGALIPEGDADVATLAVIERHHATGSGAVGLVSGLGLREGALASTVAHDSHNLVVAGRSPEAMLRAAEAVVRAGGGQAAAVDDEVTALLPLPVGGLMSDRGLREVAQGVRRLQRAAAELGCPLDDPMMALSFLALPVIPSLRLTDRGLVDVDGFDFVPVVV